MSRIRYLPWPDCLRVAITKALSSGPQGPFTQWCNVCTRGPPRPLYQGPPPGPSMTLWKVCSFTALCVLPLCTVCAQKQEKEPRVRWWRQTRQTERAGACRSWSGSIKGPPSMLLWSERRGWRFRTHSSLFMPWRCVKKTGWGPCRHAGLGRLILSWPTTDRGAPSSLSRGLCTLLKNNRNSQHQNVNAIKSRT